ncbi:hypothetical protein [Streptomyces sp. NBC_01565]|uniref:hypothetical protein n=1 Tax=unclassified Streptomyces TaxID=2593676 RepID=UPI002254662E|nr:hypothetical protein [Streptomyces sp. NBC_01565]MCX4546958.1 hypothetical protein [Streptomyces sp. NBC_01565]
MIRNIVHHSSPRRRTLVGAALLAAIVPTTTAEAAAPSNSDLQVVRVAPDAAVPGGTTTVLGHIANPGPEQTASPFTVMITLPEGTTAKEPIFPQDCIMLAGGRQVRCVFPAGLAVWETVTAEVPVELDPTVPIGRLEGGTVTVHSADDKNPANNEQPFVIEVVQP